MGVGDGVVGVVGVFAFDATRRVERRAKQGYTVLFGWIALRLAASPVVIG